MMKVLLQVMTVLQTAVQLCTPDRQENVKQDERPAATAADILHPHEVTICIERCQMCLQPRHPR